MLSKQTYDGLMRRSPRFSLYSNINISTNSNLGALLAFSPITTALIYLPVRTSTTMAEGEQGASGPSRCAQSGSGMVQYLDLVLTSPTRTNEAAGTDGPSLANVPETTSTDQGSRSGRPWTQDEDRTVLTSWRAGSTFSAIARTIDRSNMACSTRLNKMKECAVAQWGPTCWSREAMTDEFINAVLELDTLPHGRLHRWTQSEDQQLLRFLQQYSFDYDLVQREFPGRSKSACIQRADALKARYPHLRGRHPRPSLRREPPE